MRNGVRGNLFWRPLGHDLPAACAPLEPHIHNPVGFGDEIEVVLNNDDRVPRIHQALQHGNQASNILDMQSESGFFEHKEVSGQRPAGSLS